MAAAQDLESQFTKPLFSFRVPGEWNEAGGSGRRYVRHDGALEIRTISAIATAHDSAEQRRRKVESTLDEFYTFHRRQNAEIETGKGYILEANQGPIVAGLIEIREPLRSFRRNACIVCASDTTFVQMELENITAAEDEFARAVARIINSVQC